MGKILEVAVIGCGSRGEAYTREIQKSPDSFKIVSACDFSQIKLDNFISWYGIKKEDTFLSEKEFFAKKRGDVLIVSTQDKDHVRHAIKGIELGYDILCEKPISDNEKECRKLLKIQQKYNKKVIVCHVLRYAPAFLKMKELLDNKVVGDIVMLSNLEPVYYFHQAHSYVRGNWRDSKETSPMILAKCCHDLDILQWFAKSKCESISSFGDLRFFKPENKPEGASSRCLDCKHMKTCPYSAYLGYMVDKFWGRHILLEGLPDTDENALAKLKEGRYGECVFSGKNNVVDNQVVNIHFENGINANLTMVAFTQIQGRIVKAYCTYGEIELNEGLGKLIVRPFGKEQTEYEISSLCDATKGHGGGDAGLVSTLYNAITGKDAPQTSLENSIESHLMGFAAEKSRTKDGKLIRIKH